MESCDTRQARRPLAAHRPGPLFVALALLSAPASAEVTRGGPSVGVSATQTRETRLNETRYVGPALDLGGVFELRRGRVDHGAGLDVGLGYLWNRLGFANLLLGFSLDYAVGVDATTLAGGRLAVVSSVGGGSRFGLYIPEDPEHISWSTAYDVAVGPRWTRAAGRNTFALSLLGSTIGLVSRSPDRTLRNNDDPRFFAILGQVHSDMGAGTWPDYGRIQLSVGWERAWGRWWTRMLAEARWQQFVTDTRVDIVDYRLVTEFRFGK